MALCRNARPITQQGDPWERASRCTRTGYHGEGPGEMTLPSQQGSPRTFGSSNPRALRQHLPACLKSPSRQCSWFKNHLRQDSGSPSKPHIFLLLQHSPTSHPLFHLSTVPYSSLYQGFKPSKSLLITPCTPRTYLPDPSGSFQGQAPGQGPWEGPQHPPLG